MVAYGRSHRSQVDFEPERWIPKQMAGDHEWMSQEELLETLDRYELLDPDWSHREQIIEISRLLQQKKLPRPFGGWAGKDAFDRPIWQLFWYRKTLMEHVEVLKAVPGSFDRMRNRMREGL